VNKVPVVLFPFSRLPGYRRKRDGHLQANAKLHQEAG
jgi:hypothetical protein